MLKTTSPMTEAFADARLIYKKELQKLELKSRTTPLSEDDIAYKSHVEDLLIALFFKEMDYARKSQNVLTRLINKITKK